MTSPATYNEARLRAVNDRPAAPGGDYVLYWMQTARRLRRNHALDHALREARSGPARPKTPTRRSST